MSQKHKLTLIGTLAFIHAVTSFVTDWQNENDTGEESEKEPVVKPLKVPTVSGTNVPIQDPSTLVGQQAPASPGVWPAGAVAPDLNAAVPAEKEKAKRPSRAKPKEEPAVTPEVTPAQSSPAGDIALPDWLKQAAPSVPQFPVQGAPVENVQPWLNEPVAPSVATPNPWTPAPAPVQQAPQIAAAPAQPASLTDLYNIMSAIAPHADKRAKASSYLASRNAADLATLSPDLHGEALYYLNQILTGAI